MEGKRTIESAGQQITEHSKLGGNFSPKQKSAFLEKRYSLSYLEVFSSQI